MKSYAAVVGIVQRNGKILLLKRNSGKEFFPGKWNFISGFVKEKESAEDAVLREVCEEIGVEGEIVKASKVFEVEQGSKRWVVIAFLISAKSDKLKINRNEHSEHAWINPEQVYEFDCVSGIKEKLESLELL